MINTLRTRDYNRAVVKPGEYVDIEFQAPIVPETHRLLCIAEIQGKYLMGGAGLAAASAGQLPTRFELSQNYPNPFNPSTTFRFSTPIRTNVELGVYNVLGQRVAIVADGEFEAGWHALVWDGRDLNGQSLASGVYFARLSADNFEETRKVVLLK